MITAEKMLNGCGKRTSFEGNGLFYSKPICSFDNLCKDCEARLAQLEKDAQNISGGIA